MSLRTTCLLALFALSTLCCAAEIDTVIDTAERYVRQQTQGFPGKPQIKMGNLDVSRLPVCTAHEAFSPPGARLSGETHVGVRCLGPTLDVRWYTVPIVIRPAITSPQPVPSSQARSSRLATSSSLPEI